MAEDDFVIQLIDANGVVEQETVITAQELREAHEQLRCGAWCGYCYEEACKWYEEIHGRS